MVDDDVNNDDDDDDDDDDEYGANEDPNDEDRGYVVSGLTKLNFQNFYFLLFLSELIIVNLQT